MSIENRHSQDTQSVPHSGNLPEELREQPVKEFDNTTLSEAHEQGRLKTPESPASLVENKSRRRGVIIGAGVAGLALAAGAVFGVNALNQAPKSEPVATAPADPSEPTAEPAPVPVETASPETDNLTVENLEVPAGLDAQTLGTVLVEDRFTQWYNAGAVNELNDTKFEANKPWDVLLSEIVDKNKSVFADALYVDDWETNPVLAQDVEGASQGNLSVLQNYVDTQWSGDEKPENKEGYRVWSTVDNVTELQNDGTSRTIEVSYENYSNSDLNEGPAPSRESGTYTITTTVVNGMEKISNITLR
jgi:hypothetical protein